MPKKHDRNTTRLHLTLYTDQVVKAQAMWPSNTLSDIVRKILDKTIEKAEALALARKTDTLDTPAITESHEDEQLSPTTTGEDLRDLDLD